MKYHRNSTNFLIKDGIHGLGVFTSASFKKGKVLFKLKGEVLKHPTRTSIEIGENLHIEDAIGAHLNHSCNPNARLDRKTHNFVSTKNILKGEEITFDYNKNESEMAAPFECHCCGKMIGGSKRMNKAIKAKAESI